MPQNNIDNYMYLTYNIYKKFILIYYINYIFNIIFKKNLEYVIGIYIENKWHIFVTKVVLVEEMCNAK